MFAHLKILFVPHEENNYRSKLLHFPFLFFFIFLIAFSQFGLFAFAKFKPGVLGFATNITAEELIRLTNQKRTDQGLAPLEEDPLLVEAAREKATDMFEKNYWAHNSPQGLTPWWFFKKVGYIYLYAGENLARDFAESEPLVKAWIKSPTHQENILNPRYEDIGIAVVNGILDGEETTLVIQLFGTKQTRAAAIPEQGAKTTALRGIYPQEVLAQKTTQQRITIPFISSFLITKSFSISLLTLLLLVLLIDGILVFKHRTVRIAGKNFIHISFLVIILIVVLLSGQGRIL